MFKIISYSKSDFRDLDSALAQFRDNAWIKILTFHSDHFVRFYNLDFYQDSLNSLKSSGRFDLSHYFSFEAAISFFREKGYFSHFSDAQLASALRERDLRPRKTLEEMADLAGALESQWRLTKGIDIETMVDELRDLFPDMWVFVHGGPLSSFGFYEFIRLLMRVLHVDHPDLMQRFYRYYPGLDDPPLFREVYQYSREVHSVDVQGKYRDYLISGSFHVRTHPELPLNSEMAELYVNINSSALPFTIASFKRWMIPILEKLEIENEDFDSSIQKLFDILEPFYGPSRDTQGVFRLSLMYPGQAFPAHTRSHWCTCHPTQILSVMHQRRIPIEQGSEYSCWTLNSNGSFNQR